MAIFSGQPDFKTTIDQIISGLLGLQGRPGQLEVFPICGKSQVNIGNFRYQQNLSAATGLFRGQIFFQRAFI